MSEETKGKSTKLSRVVFVHAVDVGHGMEQTVHRAAKMGRRPPVTIELDPGWRFVSIEHPGFDPVIVPMNNVRSFVILSSAEAAKERKAS